MLVHDLTSASQHHRVATFIQSNSLDDLRSVISHTSSCNRDRDHRTLHDVLTQLIHYMIKSYIHYASNKQASPFENFAFLTVIYTTRNETSYHATIYKTRAKTRAHVLTRNSY